MRAGKVSVSFKQESRLHIDAIESNKPYATKEELYQNLTKELPLVLLNSPAHPSSRDPLAQQNDTFLVLVIDDNLNYLWYKDRDFIFYVLIHWD